MNTHQKGALGELQVAMVAVRKGFSLAKPLIECRYDYILDTGNGLHRVQVKYADDFRNGVLRVPLKSECRNNGHRRGYTTDEIDFVLVYVPRTETVYKVGPELFRGRKSVNLRVEPTGNRQVVGVRFLKDFVW